MTDKEKALIATIAPAIPILQKVIVIWHDNPFADDILAHFKGIIEAWCDLETERIEAQSLRAEGTAASAGKITDPDDVIYCTHGRDKNSWCRQCEIEEDYDEVAP